MNSFEDNVLKEAGWGCYQKFLIALSSVYIFCSGFAATTIPVILPIAKCDLLFKLGDLALLIPITNVIGQILGSCLLGTITDVVERLRIISISLIIIFISSFITGFTTEKYLFSVTAFFLGAGIASNVMVVKINVAEQLPKHNRGSCLVFLDLFWIAAHILSSGIGYVLHPNPRNPLTNRPKQTWNFISWRITAGIVAGISLMASFTTALLQPNVRSLLSKRRKTTAQSFLKFIYAINHSDHAEKYKLQLRHIQGYIKEFPHRESQIIGCMPLLLLRAKRCKTVYEHVFSFKYFPVIILVAILRCALSGGFFVHNVWLARHFSQEIKSNCVFTSGNMTTLKNEDCDKPISLNFFQNYAILGCSAFLVLIIFTFIIDTLGRRIPILLSFLFCGTSCIMFALFKNYKICMPFSVIYVCSYSIIDTTLDVIIIENVPTFIRGTSFGLSYLLTHICDVILKYMLKIPCRETFFSVAAIMFTGSMLSYFLPDLKKKPMVE